MKNTLRAMVLFTVLAVTLSSCLCYRPGYGGYGRGYGYGGGHGHHGGGGHSHYGGGGYGQYRR